MAINAYIVENGKLISATTLNNDAPSEVDLIALLGGTSTDMAAITMGSVGKVEVNFVSSQPNRRLLIGKAPYLSGPDVRPNIGLTPSQAVGIAAAVETLWKQYGGI